MNNQDDLEMKEYYKELLKHNKMRFTFYKKNGEKRVMNCTLIPELLPKQEIIEKKDRKENEHVVCAFDLDLQEWRSFRIDSVIEVISIS